MYEALELRDGGSEYMGKGVLKVRFLFTGSDVSFDLPHLAMLSLLIKFLLCVHRLLRM